MHADRNAMSTPASDRLEPGSIRWLRALLAISILAPALVFVAAAWLDYRQTVDLAHRRLDRAVRIADEHAQKVLETSALVIARVDDLVDGPESTGIGPAQLRDRLAHIAAPLPQVERLWVLDALGHVVASTGTSDTLPGPAEQEAYRSHLAGARGLLVTGLRERGAAVSFTVSSARLAGTRFVGVTGVTLAPEELNGLSRELVQEFPDMSLVLYRADGSVVVRYPDAAPARDAPPEPSPWLALLRDRAAREVETVVTRDGRRQLAVFAPVGGFGVYVGATLPFAAMERDWVDKMSVTLAFALAAMLALGTVTWMALRRTEQERATRRAWQREAGRRAVAERALRESQRMEAMGQLTGGVAHDFNNLLMVVSGNLQILRRRLSLREHDHQLDAIGRAVERGVTLTRHLLAFSRRQALNPTTIDMADATRALCELLTHSLPENIRLDCRVAPGTWPVRADRAELDLALLNIAVNARDAMPGGGSLTVSVRNARVDEILALPGELSGEYVVIAVHDTGEGIPAEVLPRVFEPFFTTKAPGKGTGLGLSQVYGFSRQSGGTVTLQSPPGRGTTVTLWLPRSTAGQSAATPAGEPAPAQRHGTILVVEDDDTVAGVLAELLGELGYGVLTAASGTEALEKLHSGPRVDLLLTDVVMLGPMNGLQLARTVRSRFAAMPVIVMTGYAAEIGRIGAEGFKVLTKPFDLATLARAVAAGLGAEEAARGGERHDTAPGEPPAAAGVVEDQ